MKIIDAAVWLCADCMLYAVNGELDADSSPERDAAIEQGVAGLGVHLVPNFDSNADTDTGIDEFSWKPCEACRSTLGGSRHRFAILGYTQKEARAIVAPLGFTIRHDSALAEYVLRCKQDGSTYHTNDLTDAVDTARHWR